MKDFFTILTEKTQEFGNHYYKHRQAVKKHYESLRDKIEMYKKREIVHFLHSSNNFLEELQIVAGVSEDTAEKLNFIGIYTALHLLWMNRQMVDMLKMELFYLHRNKMDIYKNFMREAGNRFRSLTATYIEELLKIFLPKKTTPRFVIMGVGTKSDQDDIDVGIIDDGTENRDILNKAISRISSEMLKYVTSFHFHLSEHIGSEHYSASIEEYKKVLKYEIRDFVIINEMLGAAIIVGDNKLFEQFQKEVIERYFYNPQRNNKYHEGYLRGILGEVRSLVSKHISKSHINLKEDGLRPIKGIISAKKTIFNIWKVNAWDIIEELQKVDLARQYEYKVLEDSLTFIEIFRYLYQLFVAQEEEIVVDDIALKNIRKIATTLGYVDVGPFPAEQYLLLDYYEHLINIRRVITILINDIKLHLKKNSVFLPLFEPGYSKNMVCDFIGEFKFFKGTSYWDDILDEFGNEKVLNRFVTDFGKLSLIEQKRIVQRYIGWLKYDLYTLINFLVTMGENRNCVEIYKKLQSQFLVIIRRFPDVVRNISFIYTRYPDLINRLLAFENSDNLLFYLKLLEEGFYEEEVSIIVEELKILIRIYLEASQFLKRYFVAITRKYPEALRFLKNKNKLKELAEGIYNDISSMKPFNKKKEKLGDYYDFEMVRVSLATLDGASTYQTNTEFIEFSDQYIRTLYDLCREETDSEFNKRIITEDVLAIFNAGGHAREQAFDDDYDLIVLLNSDDPELLTYSNRVISKMNAEIIKRGTIPHHRFADYFGRFVITLNEMESLLSEDKPDIFIEQSQILGARLIVGSYCFEREFFKRIIEPKIFRQKEIYIKEMLNELHARHSASEYIDSNIDIKECSGGLRDIEMIMLILKARFEITAPVNLQLFSILSEKLPLFQGDLKMLADNFNSLKNIRDIYRLTIGATDLISPEKLNIVASIMGMQCSDEIIEKFIAVRKENVRIIQKLINSL